MSWWAASVPGGLIVIGWVLTARTLMKYSTTINDLRERITYLEAKVNGKGDK